MNEAFDTMRYVVSVEYLIFTGLHISKFIGAMVMEMPRRAGKHGRFMANSSNKVGEEYCEVVCRIIPIMDRFFSKRPKLVLHQVKLISKLINDIQYFS